MDIKAGQVWQTKGGDEVAIVANEGGTAQVYPWRAYVQNSKKAEYNTVSALGCFNAHGPGSRHDLFALLKDHDGYTPWAGGEQPPETRGKRVTLRLSDGAVADTNANSAYWSLEGMSRDIVGYKLAPETDKDFVGSVLNAAVPPAPEQFLERYMGDKPLVSIAGRDLFTDALDDPNHPYHLLARVLVRCFEQAASGKGKERHARGTTPFQEQPMATINRQLGSVDGFIYQAHKKSLEAKRLPDGRAQAELLGSINYLAGAVIALDTWAKKDAP